MPRWWVGTSGWSYPHWRGAFYPTGLAQRRWLQFYAERFPTVEVNATFYRLQKPSTFAHWAAQVPAGFRFAVKASRYLTHVKRLQDIEGISRLLATTEPLGTRLGPLLVQLPAPFVPAPDRLDAFLAACPAGVCAAVELRDLRWLNDDVRSVLTRHRAALVWSDYPDASTPDWSTAPFLYIRRHGSGYRYGGKYPMEALRDLIARVGSWDGDVYCYFNNDAGGAAALDADALLDMTLR